MIINSHGAFEDSLRRYIPWRHFRNKYLWLILVIDKKNRTTYQVGSANTPLDAVKVVKKTLDKDDEYMKQKKAAVKKKATEAIKPKGKK